MSESDKILQNLINNYYKQKPLPKTAVVFKMAMNRAIDYCKKNNIEISELDKFLKMREKQIKEIK